MKLTAETVSILKNFVQINPSILVRADRPLRTISQKRNVFASYKCEEVFERDFAIYDLSQWLAILSVFNAPEIHLEKGHMVISQGKRRVNYTYAEPSMIVSAPDADPSLTAEPTIDFPLTAQELSEIVKVSSVLQAPHLVINRNELVVKDVKNPSTNAFHVADISTEDSNEQVAVFAIEHMRLVPADYQVAVYQDRKIVQFTGTNKPINYLITGLSNA